MIIDKSGSMSGLVDDTVGGFNDYLLDRQRETPEAVMSVTLFDSKLDRLHLAQPVGQIPALTAARYRQGGMGNTALNDAIGTTVTSIDGSDLARGRRVLVVVITDGQENASTEWPRRSDIAALVQRKENDGWKFVFFGAEIDAFAEGASMNVPAARSVSYVKTADGVKDTYKRLSRASSLYAQGVPEPAWVATLADDDGAS